MNVCVVRQRKEERKNVLESYLFLIVFHTFSFFRLSSESQSANQHHHVQDARPGDLTLRALFQALSLSSRGQELLFEIYMSYSRCKDLNLLLSCCCGRIDRVDRPVYHSVDMINLRINGMGTVTVLWVCTYHEVRSWCAALILGGINKTLVMVSVYSPPDVKLLEDSHYTLWSCTYLGDRCESNCCSDCNGSSSTFS
jgi:hypothetical protein